MTNVTAEHRKTEREKTADFVQMFFKGSIHFIHLLDIAHLH